MVLWDVSWCCNNSVRGWLEGWLGLCPAAKNERAWLCLLSAVVWTVWEVRNHKVFENKHPCLAEAQDLVRFRVAWWFKSLGNNVTDSVTALMLNIKGCCVESKRLKKTVIKYWIPPQMNSFKFNVDGSARVGQAANGGVLRDQNGKIICIFSANVGNRDALTAEILAIQRATELCASNSALWGKDITFVSDSNVAVSWINGEGIGSYEHVNLIFGIRSNLNSIGQARVVFNHRFSNSVADILAKRGSGGGEELLSWSC